MWVYPPTSCLQNTYLHHLKTTFKAELIRKSKVVVDSIDFRSLLCVFWILGLENLSARSSCVKLALAQRRFGKLTLSHGGTHWLWCQHSRGLPQKALSVGRWRHPFGFLAECSLHARCWLHSHGSQLFWPHCSSLVLPFSMNENETSLGELSLTLMDHHCGFLVCWSGSHATWMPLFQPQAPGCFWIYCHYPPPMLLKWSFASRKHHTFRSSCTPV